jgi:hypothetical protein
MNRSIHNRYTRIAFAVVILVGVAHIAGAQTAAATAPMASPLTAPALAQPSDVVRPPAAVTVADSQRPAIVIDAPAPDSTVRGPAIIVFRAENIRIMSLFIPEAPDASTVPTGHLHVNVDSADWHWVHTSVDPVVVTGLLPGKHTVRLELADKNHRPLDAQTVTFTIAAPPIH